MEISSEISSPIFSDDSQKKRAGRKKNREIRRPVYKGARRKNTGKWVSEIREPNKKSRIWLGTYPTAEMAARAHDVAALALRGRLTYLNFADSAWRLPIPASGDSKDIQRAAAEAAEAFRPAEMDEISEEDVKPAEIAAAGMSTVFDVDEEAVFGMPELIADMANAMMLPPLHYVYNNDDVEFGDGDVSLWSF